MHIRQVGEWRRDGETGWYLEVWERPAGGPCYYAVGRATLRQWPLLRLFALLRGERVQVPDTGMTLYDSLAAIPLPPGEAP